MTEPTYKKVTLTHAQLEKMESKFIQFFRTNGYEVGQAILAMDTFSNRLKKEYGVKFVSNLEVEKDGKDQALQTDSQNLPNQEPV